MSANTFRGNLVDFSLAGIATIAVKKSLHGETICRVGTNSAGQIRLDLTDAPPFRPSRAKFAMACTAIRSDGYDESAGCKFRGSAGYAVIEVRGPNPLIHRFLPLVRRGSAGI